MKKLLTFLICLILFFSFVSAKNNDENTSPVIKWIVCDFLHLDSTICTNQTLQEVQNKINPDTSTTGIETPLPAAINDPTYSKISTQDASNDENPTVVVSAPSSISPKVSSVIDNDTCVPGVTTENEDSSNYALKEDFECTARGSYNKENVKFIDGKSGKGIVYVLSKNPGGGYLKANYLRYNNSDGSLFNPIEGTVSFWAKPLYNFKEDNSHNGGGLFKASAPNKTGDVSIQVYNNMFIVYRDFSPCVRHIEYFQYTPTLKKDKWYLFNLTWKGNETRFYINNKEFSDKFTYKPMEFRLLAGAQLSFGSDSFVMDELRVSKKSKILNPIQKIPSDFKCPVLDNIIESTRPNATYKGIKLYNFPDSEAIKVIEGYIDLLGSSSADINVIMIANDKDYNVNYKEANGNFRFWGRTMFLRKSVYGTAKQFNETPEIFFHEAGHAKTYALGINYGGPDGEDKRKEWANINGIENYSGECSWKNQDIVYPANGFLSAYGSSMPDEDLAVWVGTAYALYIKNETFSDLLNKSSPMYDITYQKKIDFLLKKGFISQEIYNAVTDISKNKKYYLQFNDDYQGQNKGISGFSILKLWKKIVR